MSESLPVCTPFTDTNVTSLSSYFKDIMQLQGNQKTSAKHLFLFSNHFILVRVAMDPVPIPGALGITGSFTPKGKLE